MSMPPRKSTPSGVSRPDRTAFSDGERALLESLARRLARSRPILVVSPPRSASTAFAQALKQHSSVQRYIHEPCGRYSYEASSLDSVHGALAELEPGTLIKEMTFQFRDLPVAECFFRHCATPTLFLARPPQQTFESRIRMVLTDYLKDTSASEGDRQRARAAIEAKDYAEVDDLLTETLFPLSRTGWGGLAEQLEMCRSLDLDYAIVEMTRFRQDPETTLRRVCDRLGLGFEDGMLQWRPESALPPGALKRHANWYARVGASTGILPPEKHTLTMERFPARFRDHLAEALETYAGAVDDANCL